MTFFDYSKLPKNMTPEQVEAVKVLRVASAQKFDPQGFMDFYYIIWGREAPPYAKKWVTAFMSGDWTMLYCFRGSTKSTTLTVTFTAFALGHFPHTSALLVHANDAAGAKSSGMIADIIEHYDGWKLVFPTVLPDKNKGWGAQGYFIMDAKVVAELGEGGWLQKCQKDHLRDPSLIGLGVNSGEIPGMHPRWLLFDDIHDRKNSAYPKDREGVVATVRANILPVITKAYDKDSKPFIGVACTFWDKTDAYNDMLNTGMFKLERTPIIEIGYGDVEFEGKRATLTWPEGFPLSVVEMHRKTESTAEFARMYLCDISADAMDVLYRWMSFDGDVDWSWPMVVGADPTDSYKAKSGTEGGRSHFAMAYGLRTPTGAMVIADGVLEQCAPSDVETYLVRAQNTYPNLKQITIETLGGGSVTYAFILQRNPSLKIVPFDSTWIYKEYRVRKLERQYKILEPLFRNGVLQVATAQTPFLNAVRNYLDRYPNLDEHAKEWDAADALVLMVAGAPDLQTKYMAAEGSLNLYQPKQLKTRRLSDLARIGV